MADIRTFRHQLQQHIAAANQDWNYTVPNLPRPETLTSAGLVKSIAFVSSRTSQSVHLRLAAANSNRVTRNEPLHKVLLLSFDDFRLRQSPPGAEGQITLAPARDSAEYVAKVLKTGILLNGVRYHFFGHSNSQQKSRSCYMFAGSKEEVDAKVEGLGDFSKLKSVGKKVKRIGLLFSSAEVALTLDPNRCQDIPDVTHNDYVFTDGCGLIATHLAKDIARRRNIVHRNTRYLPAVFQIRYRGYKGVLTLHPALQGQVQIQFRDSMRKFGEVKDHSFAVVEYSKPYSFGYLNDEIVLLMHALGISTETLLRKQHEHLQFLRQASACELQPTFRFLCYQGETGLAEKLLLDGPEAVRGATRKLVKAEFSKMLNKYEEQRCRIMIPQSRLLFGVCDPLGVLKPGTCFVRITHDGDGLARTVINTEILCTRNPTLHPGDLQKFRTVDVPQLGHLVDCIVFPTCGSRPSADLMSGGDLDGDKFFVTWDPDIIPRQVAPAAEYPGVKEKITFTKISSDDRADFFAKANNVSLGRVKNLYLKWARLKGPLSAECQQLNRLFSQCVDGNRIRVPQNFEDPPEPENGSPPFVLDSLHDSAKAEINTMVETNVGLHLYDVLDMLSHRDEVAMSEFELIQLTLRACDHDFSQFAEYASYFNYSALTDEQRAWLLSRLPASKTMPGLILNGLLQSELLRPEEIRKFRLDNANLHWKPVFSSSSDRMGRFLSTTCTALERFHKKLIVLQPDERLTLLIYIPEKIERHNEVNVDDTVRVFALPHSSGTNSVKYRVKPTVMDSRLFCDDGVFQLYEGKRGNTFVYLTKGALNTSTFHSAKNKSEQRVKMQQSFDDGINAECRASIALQKISAPIQLHVGRINRAPIMAAEVYVISNRDVESMRYLDMWLHYVDTEEVLPLFETEPKEYKVLNTQNLDRASMSLIVAAVVLDHKLSALRMAENTDQLREVLNLLSDIDQKSQLRSTCLEIVELGTQGRIDNQSLLLMLLDFLPSAAFLTETVLHSNLWKQNRTQVKEVAMMTFHSLLQQLILLANKLGTFVKSPFLSLLQELDGLSIQQLADLVELVALSVEQQEVALDLLLECMEPELSRLISTEDVPTKKMVNDLIGVALEHIDEASSNRRLERQLLSLQSDGDSEGFCAVKTTLRIDTPGPPLRIGDHIRFVAASPPTNAPFETPYAMDAIVVHAERGTVRLRCLHNPPPYVSECTWKYKACGSFVTSKAMIDATTAFYTGKTSSCAVYAELVGLPLPTVVSDSPTSQQSMTSPTLNASQNRALSAALSHRLTCLWGPPGTGKTQTIVAILNHLLQAFPKARFLVAAPTHNAVDNILQRYLDDPSHAVMPLRVATQLANVSTKLRAYTCDAMVGKDLTGDFSGMRDARKRVKQSRLIFTTCVGAALGLLRGEEFDVVLVDEASQQTEPETLIPLTKGCKRVVLVGDHVQLRATVQKHAVVMGLDVSLFERVYTRQSAADHDDGVARVMLDVQYRMHPEICGFPSKEFYGGKLLSAPGLEEKRKLPLTQLPWPKAKRLAFVQCGSAEDLGHQSKSNEGQIGVTKRLCALLGTGPGDPSASAPQKLDIAILTPYTRQRLNLESAIPGMTVSSIDGFQGREADIVIFVTVRCNPHYEIGFLKDLRRLNVAVTRARVGVIIVGDRGTLTGGIEDMESKMVWKRLIEGCGELVLESEQATGRIT